MKNCYFYHGGHGAIYVDGPANKRRAEPEYIRVSNPRTTINGAGKVVSVRDMDTGRYYYPAADGKQIQ